MCPILNPKTFSEGQPRSLLRLGAAPDTTAHLAPGSPAGDQRCALKLYGLLGGDVRHGEPSTVGVVHHHIPAQSCCCWRPWQHMGRDKAAELHWSQRHQQMQAMQLCIKTSSSLSI